MRRSLQIIFVVVLQLALTFVTRPASAQVTAASSQTAAIAQHTFPGTVSDWNGFECHDFSLDGTACKLVIPKQPADGKPWIWRARFWGHEPQLDVALLNHGFHVAYIDVAGLFGSPTAVARWDRFYAYLVDHHALADQVALEGMSRGGLIIYNWAAANPEKVRCIYADAPVCDIRSWPGGQLGENAGSASSWQACLQAYGLSAADAAEFDRNPIDQLASLAQHSIPLLHVVGDADQVVPVSENTAVIESRYRQLGGSIQVIHKPGVGHHPHSLKDPQPIVEFILAADRHR